jgi:predicted patatin/cPLA2 family phospholipase
MEQKTSVTELLARRMQSFSAGRQHNDQAHIALVIEAGGMRAASVGGMIEVLRRRNLLDIFDSYHGSSAGGCAAAYIVSNNSEYGFDIYNKFLLKDKIFNRFNIFTSPAIVDTDYIVDHIFKELCPINIDQLIKNKSKLFISVTNRKSGRPFIVRNISDDIQLYNALKATLRIPGPCEKGVEIDGEYYVDGGIASPFSLQSAIEVGATHLMILCAQRPQDYKNSPKYDGIMATMYLSAFGGAFLAKAHWMGYQKNAALIHDQNTC